MPPSTPATDATRRALLQALAAWQATHRPPRPNDPAQLTFFAADSPAACGSDTEGLPAPLANALGAGSVRELGALLETHHQRSLPITVRKRQGQFCTPPSLVDSVLRTALGALELGPHSTLHVLEPAAGFGAFAAATLDLCGASGRACELTTVEQDPLAGAVLDALCAVAIAEHPGIPLRHHALAGDFLLDDLDLVPGSFDLVIGNPPYVASYARQAHALGDGVRERLRARYRFARGRLNSAVCFLERALELLRPGGVLAFVLPSALFNMKSWAELRAWLVDAHELVQVRYCGEGAFRAEVPVGVLVVRKGSDHPGFFPTPRLVEVVRDSPASSVLCPPALFHRFPGTIFNPHVDTGALAFLDRMEQGTIPLGVLVEIRDGINPANLAPILISRTPQTPQHRRLVRGGDIAPYRVTWNGEWVWYDRAAIAAKAGEGGYGFLREEWIFQAPVKLIHRQTADKLVAAVDCVQLYVLNSCHCSIPRPATVEEAMAIQLRFGAGPRPLDDPALAVLTDPWFLVALYNSGPLNQYYQTVFLETERTFPQVKTTNLRTLPIPWVDPATAERLAGLARQLAAEALPLRTGPLQAQMDRLVAEAYGVDWE